MYAQLTSRPARLKLAIFLSLFCLLSAFSQAQTRVTGTVLSDSNRAAIDGASVLERGTTNGTVTGADGKFSLSVRSANAVLIVSHVGFAQYEVPLRGRSQINVSLTSSANTSLNEVVVIGYGERRKKDVTGAVSSVSAADIEKSTAVSPEQALQGLTPGVQVASGGGQPGSRPLIRIRGINTFGYAEPLYVVDGVPLFEGGSGQPDGAIGDIRGNVNPLSLINPEDIESISVLKDASAAAVYGVRASNGVVLITTKKGKAGRPRVDFSAYYGVQNIYKNIPVLTTPQYIKEVNEAFNANPDKDGSGNPYEIGAAPNFGPWFSADSPEYAGNKPTTDWVGAVINKNAPMQNYNARLSGGNDATTYYISAGYTKQESPLKANNLSRYSVTGNIDSRISKIFSAGLTIRLSQDEVLDNTQTDLQTQLVSNPYQPIYDPSAPLGLAPVAAGTTALNPDYDPTKVSAGPYLIFTDGPNRLYGNNTRFNALGFEALNNTSYTLYNALGNAYLQVEPITGLKIRGTLGGQFILNQRRTFNANDAWKYSQTPTNPYGELGTFGGYGERQGRNYNLNKELIVNYNHTFAQDHNFDITLGASEQQARWAWTDVSGYVLNSNPQYWTVRNQPPFIGASAGILQEDNLIGYLARVSYKFKDKYYLDGTFRRDGSSRLAPGHKFDNFYALGAAWRISEETFFPKFEWLNDLKLRGGWGVLGNYQSAGFYEFISGINTTPDYAIGLSTNGQGVQTTGVSLPNYPNSALTWEKLRTSGGGFDAVLFNNHLNFTAEYYHKTTFGIIQDLSLPVTTGIQQPVSTNVGTVLNQGFEFQVGYNTKLGPVNVNVAGNLTTVNNRVIALSSQQPSIGLRNGRRAEVGLPIGYIYGYKRAGIFQSQQEIDAWRAGHADNSLGQSLTDPTAGYQYQPGDVYFQDVNGAPRAGVKELRSPGPDSIIDANDRTYLGSTIPKFTYGFSFGADWMGFDVNVLFQGVGDVQGYNALRQALENPASTGNMSPAVLNHWTPTNHSTSIGRAIINDPSQPFRDITDRYVEQAGYLRLKNLTVGYSFPKAMMRASGFIQGIRVYASSLNLLTITKWTGYDPEVDVNYIGQTNQVPTTRQFLVGVKASF